ncbi:MAG: acyltransferase family protein [Deltaproteobacteria bacterium]|nr:acyltransferase family protein [Deltaproteobacteria bacterium]
MTSRLVRTLSPALDALGHALHRYEVRGQEHLPLDGPALLVLYHGFMPVDAWYLGAHLYHHTGRLVHGLGDRWLFKTPGLRWVVTQAGSVPGTRADAVALLRSGAWVLVSPGGTREALTGRDRHYQLVWRERRGFAEVALEAGVPLIPVFTENIEEVYRSPGVDARPIQALYERTRWPIVPVVGLGLAPLPVKLTTWLGPQVVPREGESPEALRERVREALEALIAAHTHPRPRIARALWARVLAR